MVFICQCLILGTHWSKPVLTWRLSRSSSSLPDLAVLHTLQMAFNIWSSATNLKFAHKSRGPVDIEVGDSSINCSMVHLVFCHTNTAIHRYRYSSLLEITKMATRLMVEEEFLPTHSHHQREQLMIPCYLVISILMMLNVGRLQCHRKVSWVQT